MTAFETEIFGPVIAIIEAKRDEMKLLELEPLDSSRTKLLSVCASQLQQVTNDKRQRLEKLGVEAVLHSESRVWTLCSCRGRRRGGYPAARKSNKLWPCGSCALRLHPVDAARSGEYAACFFGNVRQSEIGIT